MHSGRRWKPGPQQRPDSTTPPVAAWFGAAPMRGHRKSSRSYPARSLFHCPCSIADRPTGRKQPARQVLPAHPTLRRALPENWPGPEWKVSPPSPQPQLPPIVESQFARLSLCIWRAMNPASARSIRFPLHPENKQVADCLAFVESASARKTGKRCRVDWAKIARFSGACLVNDAGRIRCCLLAFLDAV